MKFIQHLLQQQVKVAVVRNVCDLRLVAFAYLRPIYAAKLRIVENVVYGLPDNLKCLSSLAQIGLHRRRRGGHSGRDGLLCERLRGQSCEQEREEQNDRANLAFYESPRRSKRSR